MDRFSFLNPVMELVAILKESTKVFLKNKTLILSILFLNCLVFLFNIFIIVPEITNLIIESSLLPSTDPNSPQYTALLMKVFEDLRQYVGSSYILTAISIIINLLSVLLIVHASALTLKDEETIKIKEFSILSLKTWKGPLVTYFYITLFSLGYWCLFFIFLCPLLLFSTKLDDITFLAIKSGALLILFALFQFYFAIIWNLSMVVSILEETYGFQALGKAAKIVKGMKLKLFLFNVFYALLSFGLSQILQLVNLKRSFLVTLVAGLVVLCLVFAVRMFQLVTYTVAYFQCKSLHGKDVESLRDVEYMPLP